MAKIVRKLWWQENTDFGDGWSPAPNDETTTIASGYGLAHDLLEHISLSDGWTVEDEFRAFGALLFIRYENGWWQDKGDIHPFQILGDDLGRIAIDLVCNQGHETRVKTRTCVVPEIEDAMTEILSSARKFIRSECLADEYSYENIRENAKELGRYFQNAKAYMREGYLRAQGIYPQQFRALECFEKLSDNIPQGEYEGQCIKVTVDTETSEVNINSVGYFDEIYLSL